MSQHDHEHPHDPPSSWTTRPHCCPCSREEDPEGISRRGFLGGMGAAALGGITLSGLSWSALSAAEPELPEAPKRRPLVVKPVFLYATYQRRPQTSWRAWGGIEKQEDVDKEIGNIKADLEALQAAADFPLKFLPLAPVRGAGQLGGVEDAKSADCFLVFAANGDPNGLEKLGKPVILFLRHKSGPLYLYYEIISPRYLRQHSDELKVKGITDEDVVVDRKDEVLWRLRSLCGLCLLYTSDAADE